MPAAKKSVVFPLSVFETADTKEDLEDWLICRNPDLLRKIRKARRDDLEGKGASWKALKKDNYLSFVYDRMQ